jgi:hypothetical protein
VLEKVGVDLS